MKILASLMFSFLCYFITSAHQWLYPIAQLAHGKVLLLQQKDSSSTHLFSWDPETGIVIRALPSRHMPVGITVIPKSEIFSFIDNGRIRIKEPTKYSARSLDISVPLYDIGPISWISTTSYPTKGFFSAKEQGNYAIYSTDLTGHVTRVVGAPGIDYLFPSCTDTGLFYITRRRDDALLPRCPKHAQCRCRLIDPVEVFLYSINVIPLSEVDVVGYETPKDYDGRARVRETIVLKAQERPFVFLTMISDTQGFVLEHAPVLQEDASNITMRCQRLFKDATNSWALSYLFSYTIPAELVLPGSIERLAEGFLPFVPCYDSGTFYFVDSKGSGLGVFSYNLATREVKELVKAGTGSLYCAPMVIKKSGVNTLIYGRNIQTNINNIQALDLS